MVEIIAIPYYNLKEKIQLMNTEFKGKKVMDLNGVILHYNFVGQDEPSARILCNSERRCNL
jgi:hypothetical protein